MCMRACFPCLSPPSRLGDKRVYSVLGLSTWTRLFIAEWMEWTLLSVILSLCLCGGRLGRWHWLHTECSKWASCGATRGRKMIAKPNATAPVWDYFGFKPNEQGEHINTDEPGCRICWKLSGGWQQKKATQQTFMPTWSITTRPSWWKKLHLEMLSLRPDGQHSLRQSKYRGTAQNVVWKCSLLYRKINAAV